VGAGPHAIVTLSIWARNKLRKLDVVLHEALQAGFVGGVLDRELGADQAVALLEAQRVQRAVADVAQAVLAA
jgi:hypothetical protein